MTTTRDNSTKEAALKLLSEGKITLTEAARRCGESRQTVTYWVLSPTAGFEREVTAKAPTKTPDRYAVIGRSVPRLDIPEGDDVFVKELLLQKHVLVVHGSGFGQKAGSRHFRIVFLPDEATLGRAYAAIGEFMRERYGA